MELEVGIRVGVRIRVDIAVGVGTGPGLQHMLSSSTSARSLGWEGGIGLELGLGGDWG